jgi:hypothetical protein
MGEPLNPMRSRHNLLPIGGDYSEEIPMDFSMMTNLAGLIRGHSLTTQPKSPRVGDIEFH